jgi:hypothetical protein
MKFFSRPEVGKFINRLQKKSIYLYQKYSYTAYYLVVWSTVKKPKNKRYTSQAHM